MSSDEINIIHDHIYLSTDKELKRKQTHRIIRKKCEIQTDEDQEEYARRRRLNNTSCRISRIHRQLKFDCMIEKCLEYEGLNRKLQFEETVLLQVINRLKEHVRTFLPATIKQN